MRRGLRVLLVVLVVAATAFETAAAARGRRRSARRPSSRSQAYRVPPAPTVVLPASASAFDQAVSAACRAGLGSLSGAVIAIDPHRGRVITVVNPDLAVSHAYQPCSVFKIVVAVAGLTEGIITPETTYDCSGGCWMWPGHGSINLRRALAVSCNPYFERVGEQLGYATVQRYAYLLGLGGRSGINLEGEVPGYLPAFVVPSRVGHVSSHAKGVATTAVQLGVLLSATINGGIVYQPQLASSDGFVARERWRLPPHTVFGGLSDGFLGAVNEGSAATAFDPDVVVAGKTGTCAGLGWFASYAPADRPAVVTVVFVRPGTGHLASTVAGRIYQHLYKPAPPALTVGE